MGLRAGDEIDCSGDIFPPHELIGASLTNRKEMVRNFTKEAPLTRMVRAFYSDDDAVSDERVSSTEADCH